MLLLLRRRQQPVKDIRRAKGISLTMSWLNLLICELSSPGCPDCVLPFLNQSLIDCPSQFSRKDSVLRACD